MKCENCGYYYKDGEYARCHFTELRGEPSWLEVPPCEEDEYYDE